MSELTRIREDHATLAKLFRQLREMVGSSYAPSQLVLFDLRRELVSTLLAHLKLEDWALYPRLVQCEDNGVSETGLRFQQEMGGLAPTFVAYCDKWSASAIETDWSGYCTDTSAILDALENRLIRENRELLPLLERMDDAA
ncbi:MAG TPA: hemerythrin domain-containing protein [Sphingomicrobium sp.]|nr:hemerythrin domain-containing protein [Sphingomicrobium sp.]